MNVSAVCRNFIAAATIQDWPTAALNLNGLDMYEMLRSIKALDTTDIASLRVAVKALGGAVGGAAGEARIEYAISVVQDRRVPATAPGDLEATGQVRHARAFVDPHTQGSYKSILLERIPRANVVGFNVGVVSPSDALMHARFGAPRTTYNQQCQAITNRDLARRMVTRRVGPVRVTGLDQAVTSLGRIMANIGVQQRLVYRVLGTAGMLCARYRRNSRLISNHAWGTAIDLTLDGELDPPGENTYQFGLELIANIFNAEGWYWGVAFRREDAMHFEAGQALVQGW